MAEREVQGEVHDGRHLKSEFVLNPAPVVAIANKPVLQEISVKETITPNVDQVGVQLSVSGETAAIETITTTPNVYQVGIEPNVSGKTIVASTVDQPGPNIMNVTYEQPPKNTVRSNDITVPLTTLNTTRMRLQVQH